MIIDDNSKEILKDPRSAAEFRITTLLRANSRLEYAVAGKLPIEVTAPVVEAPKPVAAPIVAELVLEPQLDLSGELNIDSIRHNIVDAYLDQPEEMHDEAA